MWLKALLTTLLAHFNANMDILGIVNLIVSALGGLITQIIWHFFQRLRWLHDSLAGSKQKETLNMGIDITKRLEVAGDEIKEMQKDIKSITNSDKRLKISTKYVRN